MVKGIARRLVERLLGLHGRLHDRMMRLEGIDIIFVVGKDILLDPLTEAVLADERDDFGRVFLLGIDPTHHLVHAQGIRAQSAVQLLALDHGLANSLTGLHDLLHDRLHERNDEIR